MTDTDETLEIEREDATDTADTHDEPQEHQRSERDEIMEKIAERRREALAREAEQLEDAPETAQGDDDDERHQDTHRDTHKAVEATRAAPEPTSDLIDVELDGQRFQVDQDQYRELAKLGARANVAMAQHEHNQRQQQYQQYQAQAGHQQREAQEAHARRQPAPQQQAGGISPEEATEVADRLLYGNREQVAQTVHALANHLTNQARASQMPPEAIAQAATQRIRMEQQFQNDMIAISTEFPQLWEKEEFGQLAAIQLQKIRREDAATGRRRSELDLYRDSCRRVQVLLGTPEPASRGKSAAQAASASSGSISTPDRMHVLERKRAAPQTPTAIDRRAAQSNGMPPKTGASVVEAMKKARGQF